MAQTVRIIVHGPEQMKQALDIFANAGDLSVFTQQWEQASGVSNGFQQLKALPVADLRPVVRAYGLNHRMAKLLARALSTGIKLVVQTQQQRGSKSKAAQKAELRAIHAITLLGGALAGLEHGWVTLAACEADTAAYQLQFARQVAETELLTTFAEACTSTASTLEQLRQQQQQQEVGMSAAGLDSRTAALCHLLMVLALTLENVWPGKLLVGSTFAPCVEPVNRLALAILRTRQVPEASSSSSSSIIRTSLVEPTCLWPGSLAKHVTHDLAGRNYGELSGMNPQIVQQLASDTLLQLLAANLAFAARLLHQHHSKQAVEGSAQQPGTGAQPAAKQQQQQVLLPQPYHEELLQLLDVPVLQQLELEDVLQLWPYPTVGVMYFAWQARHSLPHPSNSSNSSNRSSSVNHSGSSSCCEAAAGIPMLLVLLELIVLTVDAPDPAQFGLQILLSFLLERAESEQAAVAAGLLQPVLSQLGPAVQQAAKTASSEVAAGLKLGLLKVLRSLAYIVPPAGLAAAITQQPAISCQTLEAAIRCGAAELDDGSMSLVLDVVLALKEGDPSWQAASAEAGAEAHLFALLASCMKAAAAVASAWSSSSAGLQRDSIAAANEMLLLFQHTDAMPWLLLMARALQVFGQMVAGICSADAASVPDQPRCIPITGDCLLAECARCVEGLGPKLAAVGQQGQPAAAAEALQLMQQQQDLLQHLVQQQQQEKDLLQQGQPVQPQGGGSNSIMVPGSEVPVLTSQDEVVAAQYQQEIRQAFTAQLGQQLQQFGAAMQTQLPHQWWCNRPGCTNLDKLSELALVGGKACICAGCNVARYCSRSCQEAHWKKQHKPVCRRLAAAKQ